MSRESINSNLNNLYDVLKRYSWFESTRKAINKQIYKLKNDMFEIMIEHINKSLNRKFGGTYFYGDFCVVFNTNTEEFECYYERERFRR